MSVTQHRTQLFLDDERYQWLKQKAFEENKSIAQVVRETLDVVKKLQTSRPSNKKQLALKRLLRHVGSIKNGPKDLSINHDKYLGKALYEEMQRNRK